MACLNYTTLRSENVKFLKQNKMDFCRATRFWITPICLLVPPDKSPTRRRACIIVGSELRKIGDDLEASCEAGRQDNGQDSTVASVIRNVCVFAGLMLVGRVVWKLMKN